MFDVYFRGVEAAFHCDEGWKKKVAAFPQLGHKIYLKLDVNKYGTFKVVDIEWNDPTSVFIELERI